MGEILCSLFIFMEPKPLLRLFCDHKDTESETYEYILTYLNHYSTRKLSKAPQDSNIYTLQDGGEIVVILHIYRTRAIFLLFCDHLDT